MRAARLIPYAQLTVLAALVLAVIMTAPFSAHRPTAGEAPSRVTTPREATSTSAHHPASGGGGARPGPDPHQLKAEQAATQLLSEVRLPPGSVPVPTAPAGTPDMGGPPQEAGVEQLVDDHRFWIVPGTPQAVLAWFGAHPVSGSALVGHGSDGTYNVQQLVYDTFWLAPLGEVLVSRELMIGVAQDGAGMAIVRVDTQIVWDPTRPLQSMVPRGVVRIVATETPLQNMTGSIGSSRSRTSDDPAVVDHFVSVVNAMPEATSGSMSCPAFGGDRYSLAYESGAGAILATVTLYEDACFGISVKVTGAASVPLFDPGQALLHALEEFLPPFDH